MIPVHKTDQKIEKTKNKRLYFIANYSWGQGQRTQITWRNITYSVKKYLLFHGECVPEVSLELQMKKRVCYYQRDRKEKNEQIHKAIKRHNIQRGIKHLPITDI